MIPASYSSRSNQAVPYLLSGSGDDRPAARTRFTSTVRSLNEAAPGPPSLRDPQKGRQPVPAGAGHGTAACRHRGHRRLRGTRAAASEQGDPRSGDEWRTLGALIQHPYREPTCGGRWATTTTRP
ncbi:hypothetical protein FXF51_22125 [Nonomuraea sp. PA05]|nr:hypothetical protein FXF51_22125 [Nonomuraea sp. PA05]